MDKTKHVKKVQELHEQLSSVYSELEEQTFWRNYYQNKDIEREKECKKHTGENT